MKYTHIHTLIVPLILVLGGLLRLLFLPSIPPSLYWEEAALGYDAYSIAATGKDHHGNSFPIVAFPSFGDYKPSGYFYAIVPFVKLFGLSEIAVRLPSAIAGILALYLLYRIGKELFEEKVGMLAMFLLAIQPWHLQFSRGGWEVNLATTLTLLGAWLLLQAKKKPSVLIFSVVSFGLAMYVYHAARLFVPLVGAIGGIALLFHWYKQKKTRTLQKALPFVGISLFLIGLLLFPFISKLGDQEVSSRFSQTSVFSDLDPIIKSNTNIAKAGGTKLAKIVHHRYRYFGEVIVSAWLSHFSPDFLFVKGDGNFRHVIGKFGMLYPIEGVALIVALIFLIKQRNVNGLFVIAWILLAAVPPSLVHPAPHTLRFLFAAPAFALLASYGWISLVRFIQQKMKKRWYQAGIGAIFGVYVFFVAAYLSHYYLVYPVIAAHDWQYGYKELFATLKQYKQENEQVFVSRYQGRPSMYYLFYSQFDPKEIQRIEPSLPKDQLELIKVGEYNFVDALPSNTGLYATAQEAVPAGVQVLALVQRPDTSVVWVIWRRQ